MPGEHVHLIDNVDLVHTVGGHILYMVTQLSNLVNAVVRGAIDFKYINGITGGDFPT